MGTVTDPTNHPNPTPEWWDDNVVPNEPPRSPFHDPSYIDWADDMTAPSTPAGDPRRPTEAEQFARWDVFAHAPTIDGPCPECGCTHRNGGAR